MQCPFATGDPERVERRVPTAPGGAQHCGGALYAELTDPLPSSRRARRRPFPVDLSDKFGPTVTSCKVGEIGTDSATYSRNLAESRARLASAKAANFKGCGGVVN